jgi:SAM-dependent methyltransferase
MTTMTALSASIDPALRSDKSDAFLAFYEQLLPDPSTPINILEVGVLHGGATLVLTQRLPRATILAVDLNMPPPAFFAELGRLGAAERVTVAVGSQSDGSFLDSQIERVFGGDKLDVVIDDASHLYVHTKATFDHLFSGHVRPGGFYAIEDWGCGYWPAWPDGDPDGRHGLPRLIKELIDSIALEDRTRLWQGVRSLPVERQFLSPIRSAMIINGIAAFFRSEHDEAPIGGAEAI